MRTFTIFYIMFRRFKYKIFRKFLKKKLISISVGDTAAGVRGIDCPTEEESGGEGNTNRRNTRIIRILYSG